jgi:hypothetical protein
MTLIKAFNILIAVAVLAGLSVAQQHPQVGQSTSGSIAFDKLKALAGEWEGEMRKDGKDIPTTTSFRVVSDGSALMDLMNSGTPHEMVTMFHMDGKDLLATHYCAAHNQPRFRFVSTSEPNTVKFEFRDATKLSSPTAPHMVGVKFTLVDANHHFEDWTFLENGHTGTTRFDYHRKL